MPIVLAEGLRDIKPPVYFKANYLILIIVAAIIVFAALFAAAVFISNKLKNRKRHPDAEPKSAHQLAYEALEKLKSENLPQAGRIKEYYFKLSDIARQYAENRFRIRAPEMTTEEFLASLRNSESLSGVHKNLLKEFLNLCDIVKFAEYGPSAGEIDNSFYAAKKFVDETKSEEDKVEVL